MPHGVKAAGRRLKWLHYSSIKINKWSPRRDASSLSHAKTTSQKATQFPASSKLNFRTALNPVPCPIYYTNYITREASSVSKPQIFSVISRFVNYQNYYWIFFSVLFSVSFFWLNFVFCPTSCRFHFRALH